MKYTIDLVHVPLVHVHPRVHPLRTFSDCDLEGDLIRIGRLDDGLPPAQLVDPRPNRFLTLNHKNVRRFGKII